jgi:Transglycosylase-like domain
MFLLLGGSANATGLVAKPRDHSTKAIFASQTENLKHSTYVCRWGDNQNQRWHCKAKKWLLREWKETHAKLHPDPRWAMVKPYDDKLERIASCESGRSWGINTGNGFYGGLQFTLGTWQSVGGRGYPHQNSELEQKYRAVLLIRQSGYGPWPVCGYR